MFSLSCHGRVNGMCCSLGKSGLSNSNYEMDSSLMHILLHWEMISLSHPTLSQLLRFHEVILSTIIYIYLFMCDLAISHQHLTK